MNRWHRRRARSGGATQSTYVRWGLTLLCLGLTACTAKQDAEAPAAAQKSPGASNAEAPKGPPVSTDNGAANDAPAKTNTAPGTATASSSGDSPHKADLLQPFERTFGVYMNGIKVGWMTSSLERGESVVLGTQMRASISGMGRRSKIKLEERRAYDPETGALEHLHFSQKAATGSVDIEGHRKDGGFELEITAGSATKTRDIEKTGTLQDALAVQRMVQAPEVGKTVDVVHFDPSLQKTMKVTHRLAAIEPHVFGGVETRAVRVVSTYHGLNLSETTWLDAHGKILESKVGGFFTARLEPPEVAKQIDYQQDLLASAVVEPPKKLSRPEAVTQMRARFQGFGDNLPPSGDFQTVRRDETGVWVSVQRPAALPKSAWGLDANKRVGDYPDDVRKKLEATAFIQSDSQRLKQQAKQTVGDASTLRTAVQRLTQYVYQHVRDEYVPAYSNALEALRSGRGDCTEHAVLFVALARTLKIPARVAVGIAYWPPGDGFGWHAWSEVYSGGKWYPVDPTWNQSVADATHVKLASGGPAQQARIVMLLGQLEMTALEQRG